MLLLAGPARCELKCFVSTGRPRDSAMWVLDVCVFHRQTSKQCELGPCASFSPADPKRCIFMCVVSTGRPRSGASWGRVRDATALRRHEVVSHTLPHRGHCINYGSNPTICPRTWHTQHSQDQILALAFKHP